MAKILIVDDQSSIRELLSHILRKVSTTVITSHSLEDARTAISNHAFDLVISDLRLNRAKGMEGFELLSYVREVSPQTKVIIMSGFGTEAVKNEAYELGAMCFLEKPINISHLYSKVQSLNSQ